MKRAFSALCLAMLVLGASAADEPAAILARYLKMPVAAEFSSDTNRQERYATLNELKATPEASLREILRVLPTVKSAAQRKELAESMRWFPTKECAAKLCEMTTDTDPGVRLNAVSSLRMMARRVDRSGGKRIQRGDSFPPQVEGLTPCLVKAADDAVAMNRQAAIYALADTREPEAVIALRKRLKDEDAEVRMTAACLLTEYQDASGLEEMKAALKRYQSYKSKPETEFQMTLHSEMLLASFERITGKSFGEIPLNPMLASSGGQELTRRYKELLDAWAAWWAWEPAK